jgi:ribosomal protein S18 acetylase RimI-like enzyme
MSGLPASYDCDNGLFLVLADAGRVVGTGAIKRLDERTAELGRLWYLSSYRGRGLGRQMADRLLDFARKQNYARVQLDTSERCVDAVKLFRRLGFTEIERYKESPTTLFMELRLANGGG